MAANIYKDQLLKISQKDDRWEAMSEKRIGNEKRHRLGFQVAAKVLLYLRKNGLKKTWLAEKMGVSPQHVGKILKGRSNMTFDTIEKLQDATGLTLLEVPKEQSVKFFQNKNVFAKTFVMTQVAYSRANFLCNEGAIACAV